MPDDPPRRGGHDQRGHNHHRLLGHPPAPYHRPLPQSLARAGEDRGLQ